MGRPRKDDLKTAKKFAWKACSEYIRQKYADPAGVCRCYTCGKKAHWQSGAMQAGHGIAGRGNSILFEEEVIRPQCMQCNYFKGGQLDVFTQKLIIDIGADRVKEIFDKKFISVKLTKEDFAEIEETYLEKIKNLRGGEA